MAVLAKRRVIALGAFVVSVISAILVALGIGSLFEAEFVLQVGRTVRLTPVHTAVDPKLDLERLAPLRLYVDVPDFLEQPRDLVARLGRERGTAGGAFTAAPGPYLESVEIALPAKDRVRVVVRGPERDRTLARAGDLARMLLSAHDRIYERERSRFEEAVQRARREREFAGDGDGDGGYGAIVARLQLDERVARLEQILESLLTPSRLARAPSLATLPVRPRPLRYLAAGLFAGLIAAVSLAALAEWVSHLRSRRLRP